MFVYRQALGLLFKGLSAFLALVVVAYIYLCINISINIEVPISTSVR